MKAVISNEIVLEDDLYPNEVAWVDLKHDRSKVEEDAVMCYYE